MRVSQHRKGGRNPMPMSEDRYLVIRDKSVIKANQLIQKSRFSLSLLQQKVVLYLIAQINPFDKDFIQCEFDIKEFCRVCGIDDLSGKNYADLKQAIKDIADKSLWITLPDGRETLIRWIEKPYIDKNRGVIRVKLDEDMKPYLLQLKDNFTRYELIYTLHFRSKYTIRMYELVKSIHYHDLEDYTRTFELDELRTLLDAEKYNTYQGFKVKVLERAINEINQYSDKELSYTPIKKGKSVVAIKLKISSKDSIEALKIREEIDREMKFDPNQYTLWD